MNATCICNLIENSSQLNAEWSLLIFKFLVMLDLIYYTKAFFTTLVFYFPKFPPLIEIITSFTVKLKTGYISLNRT